MDRKSLLPGSSPANVTDQPSHWWNRASGATVVPEGRHSLRRSPNLEVLVNHGLTYSIPWQMRDLSMDGAFIEIEDGPLPEASYLEVVLRYFYKDRRVEVRLPAIVARIEGSGMALRFAHYDDEAYTNLANLLYAL